MSDKLDLYKKAKERIVAEMEQNEQHKDLFSRHSTHSVKLFIERYAEHKANLEAYGDFTKYQERMLIEEWRMGSWDALELIQQKKLLDIGLRWHAEEIRSLPDIKLSIDFRELKPNILDYQAIPDVTREDVDLFIKYLHTDIEEMRIYLSYVLFEDFDRIRRNYKEHSTTGVDYYDYHNTYTGNHMLLNLPDIRGEKETAYIELAVEHEKKEKESTPAPATAKGDNPFLHSGEEELIKFARHFNHLKTASFIKDHGRWRKEKIDSSYTWAVEYLSWIYPENVTLSMDKPWHEAVFSAAVKHKKAKIREMLPLVHEEYLMKKHSGIQIKPAKNKNKSLWTWYRDYLLKGRELKGEAQDFNF